MKAFWIAVGFALGLVVSTIGAKAEVYYERGFSDAVAAVDSEGRDRKILVDKRGRVYVANDVKWDKMLWRLEEIERALKKKGIR